VFAVLAAIVAGVLYFQGPPTGPADPAATALVWEPGKADEITAVTVQRPGDVVRFSREGEAWRIDEPAPAAHADEDRVSALVRALTSLTHGVPVDVAADRADEFGLGDPPGARVTVRTAAGEEHTLVVGHEAPVGYRTYVRGADGGIVAASGDLSRLVSEEAATFRDHRVFRFTPDDVQELSIVGPDRTVALTSESGRWWIDGLGPADPVRVDDLVGSLLDLRFGMLDGTDGGGSDPVYAVEVVLEDGSRQGLRTGMPEGDDVEAVASDGRRGTVYAGLLRDLGRSDTDLAWKTAFRIDLDADDEVTVATAAGRTVKAQRNGPAWTIEGLDEGSAYDAVALLAAIPVLGWLDAPPADPPIHAATVVVRSGEDRWTVEVGLHDSHGALANYGRGRPATIPADALAGFLAAVDKAER
jgi:hypothetical protein